MASQFNFVIGKRYGHRKLMRSGARLIYDSGPAPALSRAVGHRPNWRLFVLDPCENGDGGILFEFTRKRRSWICQSWERLRYCGNPGRELFADRLPNYPPRQVVRRDGRWWIVDKASGEVVSEYLPTAAKGGTA